MAALNGPHEVSVPWARLEALLEQDRLPIPPSLGSHGGGATITGRRATASVLAGTLRRKYEIVGKKGAAVGGGAQLIASLEKLGDGVVFGFAFSSRSSSSGLIVLDAELQHVIGASFVEAKP